MQANYKPFVDRMIEKYEGGYGWNKRDAGGPTKYGITCYDLAENRGAKMNSMAAWAPLVRSMTLQEAEDIYKKKYAKAIQFDNLPTGIDCVMMDYGVNSGPARAIRVACRLLGLPERTTMNENLLRAIQAAPKSKFIREMCDERMQFLRGLKNWDEFGRGWTTRVNDLFTYAIALVAKVPTPEATNVPSVPKGTHVTPASTSSVNGGVVSTGAAVLAGAWGLRWEVVLGVALAGILVTAAFVYLRRRQQEAADKKVVLPVTVNVGESKGAAGG